MIVEIDAALAFEIFAIWFEQHHAAPLVDNATLGDEPELLVSDTIAVIGNHLSRVLDALGKLFLLFVPHLNVIPSSWILSQDCVEQRPFLILNRDATALLLQLLVVLVGFLELEQLSLLVVIPDRAAIFLQALDDALESFLGIESRHGGLLFLVVVLGFNRIGRVVLSAGRTGGNHHACLPKLALPGTRRPSLALVAVPV